MKKLEIGDKIAFRQYNTVGISGTVDKVTDKFAFCNGNKFKREYSDDGYITLAKNEKWQTYSYFLLDEKAIKEINKEKMTRYIRSYDFINTSYENIKSIYELIKPIK